MTLKLKQPLNLCDFTNLFLNRTSIYIINSRIHHGVVSLSLIIRALGCTNQTKEKSIYKSKKELKNQIKITVINTNYLYSRN